MRRSRALERAMLDIINWAAFEHDNKSEIAEASGLTRPTVYKAQDPGWDPPISTILGLAVARDKLYKIPDVEPEGTSPNE